VDEVFLDYDWEEIPRCSSVAGPHEALTFTLSGLSKAAGLPQMKLGWTVVNGPREWQSEALARLEWIADSYLPVSAPVALAAIRWLPRVGAIQTAIRDRCRSNLATLQAALTPETGCRVMPASGGWVATLDVPRIYSEEGWVLTLVARHGVLLQPGFFYDFPREAFLVASLLPPETGFAEAAKALKECFRSV
jgi:aspartate/methionine/tyrosine aminotransferase